MKLELDVNELSVLLREHRTMTEEVIRLNAERVRLETKLDALAPLSAHANLHGDRSYLINALTVVCGALVAGNKISAIKHVREVTQLGLREAKDIVEGNYRP